MKIPAEIAAIAGVVTGNEPAHLVGEQRKLALQAMHALGYSREHMAWALKMQPIRVTEAAYRIGVHLHPHDQRPDPLAVEWVCSGTPMPLKGADREEVIRRLAATHTAPEIARLLCVPKGQVSVLASRLGVSTNAGSPRNYSMAA